MHLSKNVWGNLAVQTANALYSLETTGKESHNSTQHKPEDLRDTWSVMVFLQGDKDAGSCRTPSICTWDGKHELEGVNHFSTDIHPMNNQNI